MRRSPHWLPALIIAMGACAEARGDRDGGSFGEGLQISPGTTLSSSNYTIEGPGGFTSAGTVVVGESPDVAVAINQFPVGQGYEVTLDATASDGLTVCTGSTVFDVADSAAVLSVIVRLSCAVPSGDVSVLGTLNVCPVLDSLDASPMQLKLAGVSRLALSGHDTDSGPSPLSYSWSVNGIKLTKQIAPTLAFVCSSSGEFTITGAVSDGSPDPACVDSSSVKVGCQ